MKNQKVRFKIQYEQLGTGHAVLSAVPCCTNDQDLLVLLGDVPLITSKTLSKIIHTPYDAVIVGFRTDKDNRFGRIVVENNKVTKIVEYLDRSGSGPFETWFKRINAQAAAKVTTALVRLEGGNTSNTKSLGGGLFELKIDFGPGYRVYYGYDGTKIVILLAGGTKKRQNKDIETAKKRWTEYITRTKKEI